MIEIIKNTVKEEVGIVTIKEDGEIVKRKCYYEILGILKLLYETIIPSTIPKHLIQVDIEDSEEVYRKEYIKESGILWWKKKEKRVFECPYVSIVFQIPEDWKLGAIEKLLNRNKNKWELKSEIKITKYGHKLSFINLIIYYLYLLNIGGDKIPTLDLLVEDCIKQIKEKEE